METRADAKSINQVTQRVQDRLPEVSPEHVRDTVAGIFDEYAHSRVRDFLPILVEREAVNRLGRRHLSANA